MNHYRKKQLIRTVAPWLNRLQLPRFFERSCAGMGHILTFHRVIPDRGEGRIHNHESLEVSPVQLQQTIQFYREKGYAFYSLDQVYEALLEGRSKEPFVAFTFDDGYIDNYTIAYPILKAAGIPFCLYICTDFPDHQILIWWYLLEDMIQAQSQIEFEWGGQSYQFPASSQAEKEQTFDHIRKFINQSFQKEQWTALLQAVFQNYPVDLFTYTTQLAMTWTDIQAISQDPLVTIGAHSQPQKVESGGSDAG
ncbi:MAG: polysaccharide deacetylase family protein, partial [Bacteroidota bacterium]